MQCNYFNSTFSDYSVHGNICDQVKMVKGCACSMILTPCAAFPFFHLRNFKIASKAQTMTAMKPIMAATHIALLVFLTMRSMEVVRYKKEKIPLNTHSTISQGMKHNFSMMCVAQNKNKTGLKIINYFYESTKINEITVK